MSRVIYVNGRYKPYSEAAIHAEDRGFQFGDSVYKVIEVLGGKLIDEARHLDRLQRSLHEIQMAMPMSRAALILVIRETLRRNTVRDGIVYLQVSRGAGPRDFAFPDVTVPPNACCDRARAIAIQTRVAGIRWHQCRHFTRYPLGPLGHQDGHALARLPRQSQRQVKRRARSLVHRRGRFHHRGRVE